MKSSFLDPQNSDQSFTPDWIPKIHEEVLFMEQASGDFVVFKTSAIDEQFKIDGFAAVLWKHIDGETSLEEFYALSVEMTDQGLESLKPQIHDFFRDLQSIGLLEN